MRCKDCGDITDTAVPCCYGCIVKNNEHIARLTRERDEARSKADMYERDWYAAKHEFGEAAGRLREQVRLATRERDEALDERDSVTVDFKVVQEQLDGMRSERDEAREALASMQASYPEVADVWKKAIDEAKAQRDEARAACETFRASMYAVEEQLTMARAEAATLRRERDEAVEARRNVAEMLDHQWQRSKAAERARVVAWLRGQGAWEKQAAAAIEAGEHDR